MMPALDLRMGATVSHKDSLFQYRSLSMKDSRVAREDTANIHKATLLKVAIKEDIIEQPQMFHSLNSGKDLSRFSTSTRWENKSKPISATQNLPSMVPFSISLTTCLKSMASKSDKPVCNLLFQSS